LITFRHRPAPSITFPARASPIDHLSAAEPMGTFLVPTPLIAFPARSPSAPYLSPAPWSP